MVQWTVSNAPVGRSLRDVNARAKVKTRAKIYNMPAGKTEIRAIAPIISLPTPMKKSIKGI